MTIKWGPIYWNYLHMVSLKYPDNPSMKDIKTHLDLVKNFMNTLPCSKCRQDIRNFININDLQKNLKNKETFSKYIWELHNKVNRKISKREISFKEFTNLYSLKYSSNLFNVIRYNKIMRVVIIILLLVISYLIYKNYS